MVIDTMVFAYALLGVPRFREESLQVLESVDRLIVPDSLRAELANVMWQWVSKEGVSVDVATATLHDAEALFTHVVPANQLWERALELAVEKAPPAYAPLFVAAAERMETRLVTY
ncbi:MAG: type II toxin-antitoxin system VapC family toxin, partial [Myxococcota bacterium]